MLSSVSAETVAQDQRESRRQEVLAAQTRLLYGNGDVGISVAAVAATTLALLQWNAIPREVVIGWWAYLVIVSGLRLGLARRFHKSSPSTADMPRWRKAFLVGAGLAGCGWGAAGILLFPEGQLLNQVFLIFVLGGMMLGAASLLAPRPEAYLPFLLPTGVLPSIRLFLQGGETHTAMGVLAAVFTLAIIITTTRIYLTIQSSLWLRFENRDLVLDLQAAKSQTEALNQELELRVQERTAELERSAGQLRAEIAQREEMEEELLRVRKLESLGVLAGGIAHGFNNVITVIQGNIELAKMKLEPDHAVQRTLERAADGCQRAAFLASQLLTFAKGGAPVRRAVSVSQLVRNAVHLIRVGSPVSVSLSIADDLEFAFVDPAQIGQALHNILLNAREAMPAGGIIEVSAQNFSGQHGASVRISIRDYGCGIPPAILPRIFDPYFSTKPAASGLGLATAHAIISKHGGHILVDSKPGEGTVFTIDLPAISEVPPAEPQSIAPDVQTSTGHILVMDDEDALRALLKTVLTRAGYEVVAARDGAEAIALYEEALSTPGKRFDAVLLDLTVSGGMGGVEAAAKIRELDAAAKLIVSSGYSDAPVMSAFQAYGFDAVIPKPWTAPELSEVIRRVLVRDPETKMG